MQSASILIVEDESIVAMDISYQLDDMGYYICAVTDNGQAAIELAAKHRPDIILMDIILKGDMDGIDTARHISHRFHIPIIFLTAYSDVHTVERAARVAPYGYLTKPFQANELRAGIEVALYKAGLEKRLRDSERWFASTLRCVADAVIAVDEAGKVQFLNLAAEALLEWKLPEAKGHPVDDVLYMKNPRTGERVQCPALRALRNDTVVGIAFGTIVVSRTGFEFPIDDSAAPIRNDEGKIIGAVMAFRDVSMRLKIEQALKQSEEHFRKVFDFAPVGMALIGMNGEFLEMNTALCKLLGYDQNDLLTMRQTEVTHPSDLQGEQTYLNQLVASHTVAVQFEKRYLTKDGTEKWVQVSASLLTQDEAPMCYLYQIHDLTERKSSEYELARLAHSDMLTGLSNRSRLFEEAEDQILVARRQQSGLAIVYMDLDHFKPVNDNLGHEAGDDLLREAANRLKDSVRATDCLARFGGDEFVLLLPNVYTPEDVSAVTSKIFSAFAEPFVLNGQEVKVGISMGVSLFPNDGIDTRTLLKCADSALYQAKALGRNNVQFYSAEFTARIEQRAALEADLRRAIEQQEFEVYFQPILAIDGSASLGAEAFLRWNHPERGLVMPEQFLPLAEETGLILPIGEWVIDHACRQVMDWQKNGKAVVLSINISYKQLKAGTLADRFGRLIMDGLDPQLIYLDIPEQFLIDRSEENLALVAGLKRLGLRISIDDFGVSYASLSNLKRFGADQLKIDRSFVDTLAQNSEDGEIIKTIIAIAHGLKIQVVAEGVETETQRNFMREEGCDLAQGFFYAQPLTAEEFGKAWLENGLLSQAS